MAAELFTLFGRITTNASQVVAELGKVDAAATGLGQRMGSQFQRAGQYIAKNREAITGLGTQFAMAGAAIVGTLGMTVRAAANFDQAMTESLAIMGDVTAETRAKLEETAREVARTTTISATEAARAYFYLASAGLSVQQSLASMPIVARFAQAGMFDMATATSLLADAQSALGLKSQDTAVHVLNLARVADVLSQANIMANANIQQFSEALTNKAGAALRLLSKDVEEGVAVLATLADQGVKGTEAGEKLNIALRDLQTASIKQRDEFVKLNISVYDSSGNMRNMADIIGDLEKALGGMSDEQRRATLMLLGFQDRSVAVIMQLIGTSDAIRKYEKGLREAGGTTKEIADKQLQSLSSQLKILANRFDEVAGAIGQQLMPQLTPLIDKLGETAEAAAKLAKEHPGMTRFFAEAAGGAGLLFLALAPILYMLPNMQRSFTLLTATKLGFTLSAIAGGAATGREGLLFLARAAGATLLTALKSVAAFVFSPAGLIVALAAVTWHFWKAGSAAQEAAKQAEEFARGKYLSPEAQTEGFRKLGDAAGELASAQATLQRLRQSADQYSRGVALSVANPQLSSDIAKQEKAVARLQKMYDDLVAAQGKAGASAPSVGGEGALPPVDAEKAHKEAMETLALEREKLALRQEEAVTSEQEMSIQRELIALVARFARDGRLTQTERIKLLVEERQLRKALGEEQFEIDERNLQSARTHAVTLEAERAAVEALRNLYAERAANVKLGDDVRAKAADNALQSERDLAALSVREADANLRIQAVRAKSWADERSQIEATIRARQQEEADPLTGWERRKAIEAEVLGLRQQLWAGDEQHLQTLHEINLAEATSFAQQRALIEAELARAREGAARPVGPEWTEDQQNAARQRAVQLQQALNGLNDEAVNLQREYTASLRLSTAEQVALINQRIADQQKLIDNAEAEGRPWQEVERAQAAINGLIKERTDVLLRTELAEIEQRIATERAGYDEKIRLLQQALAAEQDATKQVELRNEIRSTGLAAINAEVDKLRESGQWELMSLQQQRDLLADLLSRWSEIAGVALPDMQRQLTEMDAQLVKTQFSLRGFMVGTAADMKSSFDGFFTGLMDGTKRFGDLWQAILANINRWLAQIISQYAWDQTFGKLLGSMVGAAAGAGGGGPTLTPSPTDIAPMLPPAVPALAAGGVFRRPTLALIAERGEPEVVTPLSQIGQVAAAAGAGGGAGAPIIVNLYLDAIDAQGSMDFVMKNRAAIGTAVQTVINENAPLGRRR